MEAGDNARRARRRARVIAGCYFLFAAFWIVYACVNPGTYSLNFLIPYLVTAPASMGGGWLVRILDLPHTPTSAAMLLAACAMLQAAVLYGIAYTAAKGSGKR